MFRVLILPTLIALCISAYTIYLLIPIARHLGLIDEPGGRKHHDQETPLVGGIAIFLGFAFAMLTLPVSLAPYRSLIAGASLLIITGVLDDLHEIPPYSRLIAQTLASLCMVFWGGNYFSSLGDALGYGNILLSWSAIPLSIIIVIATINAMNMLDGIDGLLGGLVFIFLTTILLIEISHFTSGLAAIILILLSATISFLAFNFPFWKKRTVRVFMGDSGSMFIGYCLIWIIAFMCSRSGHHTLNISLVLWILAVPIFDIINVTIRRLYSKRNPLHASRDHIHHYFIQSGASTYKTVWLICAIALITNMIAITANYIQLPQYYLFYSFSLLFILLSVLYQCAWQKISKE